MGRSDFECLAVLQEHTQDDLKEAEVEEEAGPLYLAEFVVGKTRSKGWEPMWIALSALRPLL